MKNLKIRSVLCIFLFICSAGVCDALPKKVETVRHSQGEWELKVDGEPFIIKGVVYNFSVVGDDPDEQTLRDWSILDLDQNGKNDLAYDSWVDANTNNIQDLDEQAVGDWQLLKDMGANTIRIYQMPSDDKRINDLYVYPGSRLTFVHPPNKEIFRDLEKRFGIMTIVGHFFGEWGIGSDIKWENGTDYSNPQQRKDLLMNVRVMVEEHKDEPYTLLWLLGNENFNPYDHDNAENQVESFLTLVNEAAELIHELDPNHPVAICNWDLFHLEDIAKWCPSVDIFGLNSYRWGFKEIWKTVKETFDRPIFLTEYGFQAKLKHFYDDGAQARYHMDSWKDIEGNSFGQNGVGNSIGGVIFSWCDQWHLGGTPSIHDMGAFMTVAGAEWYGITGQGDGSKSPYLRQLRKSYFVYKDLWTNSKNKNIDLK
ncbi:MAG: hypothetical protein KKF78_11035 [Candidatus Omnitrophica bacterium]|nr:hypothetical protein [Candidatus Omnitrophota bacterium]MBU1997669.1 hypothetical protein [Candidatus Omnitrophota bacterium]